MILINFIVPQYFNIQAFFMRKQSSQVGGQSQSFCLRYQHWGRMRERQIQKIKEKIRKMYLKQQESTFISNVVSDEDEQIKMAVEQFRNKLKLNNQRSNCKICEKRDQMEDKSEGMYEYIRYNKSFCHSHERQVIEDSIATFRDKPCQIIKIFEQYELEGENVVQIKRTLSFICYLLTSSQYINYEILSNFNILSLIVDGWFQYWIEELYSQKRQNFNNSLINKLKYLVKQCKRLMIMCRLLNFNHDQSWKIIHQFIVSVNATDQLIGYDWVLWVLNNIQNSQQNVQGQRIREKLQNILMKQIYGKDLVNDIQINSEVIEMQIQISDKYLYLRLSQYSIRKEETDGLIEQAKRWFILMKKQLNKNKSIIEFSQFTHQCMENIQHFFDLTISHDENQSMSQCMDVQFS